MFAHRSTQAAMQAIRGGATRYSGASTHRCIARPVAATPNMIMRCTFATNTSSSASTTNTGATPTPTPTPTPSPSPSTGSSSFSNMPPSLAARDAALPDLSSFEPDEDPKVIAARILEEEDQRREASKKEWRGYFLTHGIAWGVSLVVVTMLGYPLFANPFKPQVDTKPLWTLRGPINEHTPQWVVWVRQRLPRRHGQTAAEKEAAWLDVLREKNKFEQEIEQKYKEKYGSDVMRMIDLQQPRGIEAGSQAISAAQGKSRQALEEKEAALRAKSAKQ